MLIWLVPVVGILGICSLFYFIGASNTIGIWATGSIVAVVAIIIGCVVDFLRSFRM